MSPSPITVAVVDDHHLFRAGLIEILRTIPDISVIAEGATGAEAAIIAAEQHPDIMIVDVEMPGKGPEGTIQDILTTAPATRIVIITMHDDPQLLTTLISAGASGYLLKSADRNQLIAAISGIHLGDDTVFLVVSRTTIQRLSNRTAVPVNLISARESEVLQQLSQARSTKEIATHLNISAGTVKRHLTNLYNKLDATTRMEAVRKAEQLGLLERHNR